MNVLANFDFKCGTFERVHASIMLILAEFLNSIDNIQQMQEQIKFIWLTKQVHDFCSTKKKSQSSCDLIQSLDTTVVKSSTTLMSSVSLPKDQSDVLFHFPN